MKENDLDFPDFERYYENEKVEINAHEGCYSLLIFHRCPISGEPRHLVRSIKNEHQ